MERKETVERALREYLRPGETVCWQGKAERFPLLAGDTKGLILGKWIGTVVAAGAILILYIRNNDAGMGTVGLVLLVAALLMLSPFVEQYSLQQQAYWITNQRAILMTRDRTFYYMELREIDDFQLLHGKAAQDCLVLGSCLFEEVNRQLRWRACHPKTDVQSAGNADVADGMVFYCVSNAEGAAALLRRRDRADAA